MKTVLWDRTLFLRPLVFILLPDLVLWQLQQINKTTKNNNLHLVINEKNGTGNLNLTIEQFYSFMNR